MRLGRFDGYDESPDDVQERMGKTDFQETVKIQQKQEPVEVQRS